ncbi:hypothetical protein TcCL_ESM05920 [Trypanosoma cruzi]|nr:hypothetical protein TcCL_ESM05920 [Trypanosoma cruzi]
MLFLRIVVPVMGSVAYPVILTSLVLLLVALPVDRFGHLLQRHLWNRFECSRRTYYPEKLLELFQLVHHRRHRTTARRGHTPAAHGQSSSSRLHTQSGEGQRKEDEKNTHTHISSMEKEEWRLHEGCCHEHGRRVHAGRTGNNETPDSTANNSTACKTHPQLPQKWTGKMAQQYGRNTVMPVQKRIPNRREKKTKNSLPPRRPHPTTQVIITETNTTHGNSQRQ